MRNSRAALAEDQVAEEPQVEDTSRGRLAVTGKSPLPESLSSMMEEDAGRGTSQDAEDNMVPLVYILQDQSPQVLKRNPAYIEGAETGCIWLRNAPDPIVRGEDGMDFQPCYFEKDIVEWRDRDKGGGFIARHKFQQKEDGGNESIEDVATRLGAKKVVDPENPNRISYVLPNTNELVETRYHIGHVIRDGQLLPFVIPLSSTGHSFSREWMFKMNAKRTQGGKPAGSYSFIYHLSTRLRSNASGEWYVFAADDGTGFYDYCGRDEDQAVQLLLAGRALNEAFASGAKQADAPLAEAGPGSASTEQAEQVI